MAVPIPAAAAAGRTVVAAMTAVEEPTPKTGVAAIRDLFGTAAIRRTVAATTTAAAQPTPRPGTTVSRGLAMHVRTPVAAVAGRTVAAAAMNAATAPTRTGMAASRGPSRTLPFWQRRDVPAARTTATGPAPATTAGSRDASHGPISRAGAMTELAPTGAIQIRSGGVELLAPQSLAALILYADDAFAITRGLSIPGWRASCIVGCLKRLSCHGRLEADRPGRR